MFQDPLYRMHMTEHIADVVEQSGVVVLASRRIKSARNNDYAAGARHEIGIYPVEWCLGMLSRDMCKSTVILEVACAPILLVYMTLHCRRRF
jgi:hypothetical protein